MDSFCLVFLLIIYCAKLGISEDIPLFPPGLSKFPSFLKSGDERLSKCGGIDIRELSILQIQDLLWNGKLSSVQLTTCYIKRIEAMGKCNNAVSPSLNTVLQINPNAIREAYEADARRSQNRVSGNNYQTGTGSQKRLPTMDGIPVLLKDCIGVSSESGMETLAGTKALEGTRPKFDSTVVKNLRESGAIILGKSAQSTYFRGTNTPTGWSVVGGQTLNPFNLSVSASGSSTGSAVAITTNLMPVALGVESDGSIVSPSNYAGIFGLKTTLGLPTMDGSILVTHTQDVVGPMGKTASDVAILLDGMVSQEQKNQYACKGSYFNCIRDIGIGTEVRANRVYRIGVPRFPFWDISVIDSDFLRAELPLMNSILVRMAASSNFKVIDPVIYDHDLIRQTSYAKENTIFLFEFKYELNKYLSEVVDPATRKMTSLADIIQFTKEHPYPNNFNQDLVIDAQNTNGLQNTTYLEAVRSNHAFSKELLISLLNGYKLDAIVVPSDDRGNGVLDKSLQDSFTSGRSLAATAGFPCMTVPVGLGRDSVPFGMTFIGRQFSEGTLLQIGYLMEESKLAKRFTPNFTI